MMFEGYDGLVLAMGIIAMAAFVIWISRWWPDD